MEKKNRKFWIVVHVSIYVACSLYKLARVLVPTFFWIVCYQKVNCPPYPTWICVCNELYFEKPNEMARGQWFDWSHGWVQGLLWHAINPWHHRCNVDSCVEVEGPIFLQLTFILLNQRVTSFKCKLLWTIGRGFKMCMLGFQVLSMMFEFWGCFPCTTKPLNKICLLLNFNTLGEKLGFSTVVLTTFQLYFEVENVISNCKLFFSTAYQNSWQFWVEPTTQL